MLQLSSGQLLTSHIVNPAKLEAGDQHWGHATSPDLYHWTNQQVAIKPENRSTLIFSGSAVVDSENTSGFFPNQTNGVVAIYTADMPAVQNQHIAYSTDGGYTFVKYSGNPVINSTTTDFRDPKVFWHSETRKWVMVVSWAADLKIGIYTSPNLKDWTPASNFTQKGLPGGQFECPNLVRFPVGNSTTKDVLFISVNPGAPMGGSGTYYLVGNFNGTHFKPDSKNYTVLDFARDNYAVQFFSNPANGSKPISMSWASNWDYTNEVPTAGEGWRGAATVPHEHSLKKVNGEWVVTRMPFKDLAVMKEKRMEITMLNQSEVSVDLSDVNSNAIYFDVAVKGLSPNATGDVSFNFTSSRSDEYLDGALHLDNGTFWMSRAGTHGFTSKDNGNFTSKFNTTVSASKSGKVVFSALFDRSVFEVFVQNGTQSGTMVFYPTKTLDILTFNAERLAKNATVDIEVWGLKSGWTNSTANYTRGA